MSFTIIFISLLGLGIAALTVLAVLLAVRVSQAVPEAVQEVRKERGRRRSILYRKHAHAAAMLHGVLQGKTIVIKYGAARLEISGLALRVSDVAVQGYYPIAGGPSFVVKPESFADSVKKEYGHRDSKLGNKEFDAHFMVSCSDESATQAVWGADSPRIALESFPALEIRGTAAGVALCVRGSVLHLEHVQKAAALVRKLVSADIFGYAAIRGLDGVFDEQRGQLIVEGLVKVKVEPLVIDGAPRSCAHTEYGESQPTLKVGFDGDQATLVEGSELPPLAINLAKQIGVGKLEVEAFRGAFCWEGIQLNTPSLAAAVKLLQSLAPSHGQGIYR